MQSITSPEYHIYKWGGSREPGLLNVKMFFFRSLLCNVTTLDLNVATFKRRDAFLPPLWNVATWILTLSGTSRRGFPTSRRRF